MSRLLKLHEIKVLQIQMLKYFDEFCRNNNITYFITYGTLLGAIRHKGYIPWDDDIDVMVPRPEIRKLIRLFKSDRYKICTAGNHKNYDFPFPRLIDTTTFRKVGIVAKTYGVSIDIYPIDAYPNSEEGLEAYKKRVLKAKKIRLMVLKLRNRILKILPLRAFPFVKMVTLRHERALSSIEYSSSSKVHVCSMKLSPLDKSVFEDKVEVEFENHKYYAPIGWDEFLRNSYGDYMQLPPENKRIPYHNNNNIYSYLN